MCMCAGAGVRAEERTLWRNETRYPPVQDTAPASLGGARHGLRQEKPPGLHPGHRELRQQETLRNVSVPSLVFVKMHKVGGSTVGGVVRRLGEQFGLSGTRDRKWISSQPGVWANHATYSSLRKKISKLRHSFVIGWVRNPVERCLSAFYHFKVSRKGIEPTDEAIIRHARECKDEASRYLGTKRDKSAEQVAAHYDFIGMTERFEDSMLLLRHRLGPLLGRIRLGDLLYLKSKDSNAGPGAKDDLGVVFVPRKPYAKQSPRVRAYFDSAEFMENNANDWDLWRAVNVTLNQGRELLSDETRAEFHTMLTAAASRCREFIQEKRDCFWNDNGCGISCLDSVAGHDFVRVGATGITGEQRKSRGMSGMKGKRGGRRRAQGERKEGVRGQDPLSET